MSNRYRGIALATVFVIGGLMAASTPESHAGTAKRVPAEWEPQEALWLQWPGRYEKSFENAFAKMAAVIVQYQTLNILHNSSAIREQARAAISKAGGDPDHENIVWHAIKNDSAWMRDNGPVFIVEDGEMRVQNWEFDAWGGCVWRQHPISPRQPGAAGGGGISGSAGRPDRYRPRTWQSGIQRDRHCHAQLEHDWRQTP